MQQLRVTTLRVIFRTILVCIELTVLVGGLLTGSATRAASGDQIKAFLNDLQKPVIGRNLVELYRLDVNQQIVSKEIPGQFNDVGNRIWITRATATFLKTRVALARSLSLSPPSSAQLSTFHPDWCIVYREAHDKTTGLWIDSNPASLQVRLSTSLDCPSDKDVDYCDTYGLQEATDGGTVNEKLTSLLRMVAVDEFLAGATTAPSSVEFYHFKNPVCPTTCPPSYRDRNLGPIPGDTKHKTWPSRLLNDSCFGEARVALGKALEIDALSTPAPQQFRPTYCVVQRQTQGKTSLLWVDSDQSELQMQLWVTGYPDAVGASGIQKPAKGSVDDALKDFVRIVEKPYDATVEMKEMMQRRQLAIDVMSLDPKAATNILKQKYWSVLGKVSLPAGSAGWESVDTGLGLAINRQAAPQYTAQEFRPRLAISMSVPIIASQPTGPRRHYVLMMSFDSRLAELYVDNDLQGCLGINNTGVDQVFNNILSAAGQPLKPKSASSGN